MMKEDMTVELKTYAPYVVDGELHTRKAKCCWAVEDRDDEGDIKSGAYTGEVTAHPTPMNPIPTHLPAYLNLLSPSYPSQSAPTQSTHFPLPYPSHPAVPTPRPDPDRCASQ